ncbi:MAG: glutathione S-transferase family protein [Gammaproteobacteria bacterium]|nr:glutathione S-transferase family protein [Gammaproteobacteria bacterium]
MQLVGMLDSPYVRRVAITAQFLGIPYEHNPLSIFKSYDEFRKLNPLVKVPTLICDDGEMLVDSSLIIVHLQSLSGDDNALMPQDGAAKRRALQLTGVALVAKDKMVQIIYETRQRPAELVHQPWIDRVAQQLRSAFEILEAAVGDGESWLFGDSPTVADISIAVAWRFSQLTSAERVQEVDYPGLVRFSARAEALPQFRACPL